eukprot:m.347192 g.347192  ORF g.347192 m.347192 type:complete len:367 (+) comp27919_c1_seq3:1960-3060(+)
MPDLRRTRVHREALLEPGCTPLHLAERLDVGETGLGDTPSPWELHPRLVLDPTQWRVVGIDLNGTAAYVVEQRHNASELMHIDHGLVASLERRRGEATRLARVVIHQQLFTRRAPAVGLGQEFGEPLCPKRFRDGVIFVVRPDKDDKVLHHRCVLTVGSSFVDSCGLQDVDVVEVYGQCKVFSACADAVEQVLGLGAELVPVRAVHCRLGHRHLGHLQHLHQHRVGHAPGAQDRRHVTLGVSSAIRRARQLAEHVLDERRRDCLAPLVHRQLSELGVGDRLSGAREWAGDARGQRLDQQCEEVAVLRCSNVHVDRAVGCSVTANPRWGVAHSPSTAASTRAWLDEPQVHPVRRPRRLAVSSWRTHR